MRVLVVESDRHSADHAIAELRAGGHRAVRCHEPDLPAFPCAALREGICALDRGGRVDVVLDLRDYPYPDPTPYEDGVSCALRRGIPLVVAGEVSANPFGNWASRLASEDEIVRACEDVATTPVQSLRDVARDKAREVLAFDPDLADAVAVSVGREGGSLRAVVTLPEGSRDVDGALAVAIAGALRRHDPRAEPLGVVVKRRGVSNHWEFGR